MVAITKDQNEDPEADKKLTNDDKVEKDNIFVDDQEVVEYLRNKEKYQDLKLYSVTIQDPENLKKNQEELAVLKKA